MRRFSSILISMCIIGLVGSISIADSQPSFYKALGVPAHRKVDESWNRFHNTQGLHDILKRVHQAYPKLTLLYPIGKSYEGRDILCLEVTNRQKGNPSRKPGMYIDGNIHGNEVQAGEVIAYTAWYLCESYGKNEHVTDLLDRVVFYLVPTINPDGRDHWFEGLNTPHSSRSGKKPYDNDHDGLIDEDDYDDLDGDGQITRMRIKDPNGRWKKHPDYPDYLMVRAKDDERGEYTLLGWEGIDNDGDGRINEDGPGGYDSNRNWGFDWQPWYIQYGAIDYPFSLPNTRAVADFVLAHPNIGGSQSYHNSGGQILREPQREGGAMESGDDRVLSLIAAKGEQMLPFYRSLVVWRDLYTVWGGETGWLYGARGIYAFVNELWLRNNMYRNNRTDEVASLEFDKYLLMNEAYSPWKEVDHPTYGQVEVGGSRKEFGRVPPSFLLEEECHRNMMYTLYHASQLPRLSFGDITVESLEQGVYKIWVEIKNETLIPTRAQHDVKNHISPPDVVTLKGSHAKVLASGRVTDRFFKRVTPVHIRKERVELARIPGLNSETVQFIVAGKGTVTLQVDSAKGGLLETSLALK